MRMGKEKGGERKGGRVRRGESSLVSRTMHTKGEGRGRSMIIIIIIHVHVKVYTCTIQIFEFLFKRNCLTDPDCICMQWIFSSRALAAHAPVSPPPAPRRAPPPG